MQKKYIRLKCKICEKMFIGYFNQKYCDDCKKIKKRELHKNNRHKYKEYDKKYKYSYRRKNRKKLSEYMKNYRKEIGHRLVDYLRSRIWVVLKGISKSETTINLIGCSIRQLKNHLENQFKTGMNWNNWGTGWNGNGKIEWHIDHINPCCKFDLTKPKEQQKCFHYTNLQPLWAKENWSKNGKYKKEE